MSSEEKNVAPAESDVHARVTPKGSLEVLSQFEVDKLLDSGQGGLYPLFRRCALAVLNSGTQIDDAKLIFERYREFDLRIVRQPRSTTHRPAPSSTVR
jgi:hypothetical protein